MLILINAPLGAWEPPYQELRLTTPGLLAYPGLPAGLFGIAAIGSVWLARRAPLLRRRRQIIAIGGLHVVALASLVAAALLFIGTWRSFFFDAVWLEWGFFLSLVLGLGAAATALRALASDL